MAGQACSFLARLPRALCVMADSGIKGGPRTFLRRRRHVFADLSVRWFEGGHHVHLDSAAPVAAAIAAFLRPVMASPTAASGGTQWSAQQASLKGRNDLLRKLASRL